LQNYVIEIEGGKQVSPDDEMFSYKGDWTAQTGYSNFGHTYIGKQGATVEFTFEGNRMAILSSESFGKNFKVEIDGKEVNSIELVAFKKIGASYVSELLSEGTHTVKITCTGEANIDSFVTW
jgi:hypothetical protein